MKIAVIGSGISGLSCAWLLSKQHDVTLFEKDDRFGGHSNTQIVERGATKVAVDTGFMVFNPQTYPNLLALFDYLQVPVRNTDMSFSVSLGEGRLEYAGSSLNTLFGQRRNLARPAFWQMLRDILRFYRDAPTITANLNDQVTLGELLDQQGYSRAFINQHLLPMGAAIWSTPASTMLDYPARTFMHFCENHGLLKLKDRPQWKTIEGGSRVYVDKLVAEIGSRALANSGARLVRRQSIGDHHRVLITDWRGQEHAFDHVIMACHADQSLSMLRDASIEEQQLLGAFKFERNRALLHSDASLMPKRQRVWASWNYLGESSCRDSLAVSYWMNRLQNLPLELPLFVTLNPGREPRRELIHAAFLFDHPLFDVEALSAQRRLWSLQGVRNTWYCGAWFGYGFHEDGLQSGLAVARALAGISPPWRQAATFDRLYLPKNWDLRATGQEAA